MRSAADLILGSHSCDDTVEERLDHGLDAPMTHLVVLILQGEL